MASKWTIYHNPKCSKSRQALELLKINHIEAEVVEYLKTGLEKKVLKDLIDQSKMEPESFLRKKEKEFSVYKDKNLNTATAVAKIISETPKLLERPVIVKGKKVIIARPTELIEDLL